MRPLSLTVNFLSYDGNLALNSPDDATKLLNQVQETSVKDVSRQQIIVADSTSDQSIALPNSTSEYLLICVDQEITINVNGLGDITLKPRANGIKTIAYYLRGAITSLTVSNASGAAANLDIILVHV